MSAAPVRALAPPAEHGILYQAPMILALLRPAMPKTHTRRLQGLKMLNDSTYRDRVEKIELREDGHWWFWVIDPGTNVSPVYTVRCPYGGPGDRLWVRETWRTVTYLDHCAPRDLPHQRHIISYAADAGEPACRGKTRSPLFLPRWASRIALELVNVQPERLQSISAGDAIAEGLARITKDDGRTMKYGIPDRDGLPGTDDLGWPWAWWDVDPIAAYRRLWDGMHAKAGYGWATNPWVWRLVFRRLAP